MISKNKSKKHVPYNPRLDVTKKYGIKNNLTNKFIESRPVQYMSAFRKQPTPKQGRRFFNNDNS